MPVPRHAWWRGIGLTWRGPAWGVDEVAGLAAPPTLARQCRALIRGAAEPNKYRAQSRLPEQQARLATALAARPTVPERFNPNASRRQWELF